MDEEMMPMLISIVGVMVMAAVLQGIAPPAPPEPTVYTCPICGETFTSYEDLYNHFSSEHPAEPIDIIWE